jgi:WD40 repeat protein
MRNNPYVGPRPYERGDRRSFYGRTREARDLLSLIMAERVVLFYAPSGAGKTSLLNAQIIPALEEEEGFHVLPAVRVGSDLPPGIDSRDVENIFVFSVLMGLAGEKMPAASLTGHSLLSFLRQICSQKTEDLSESPPILILDQFEEILTTHRGQWQDAQGFFEQTREALHEIPELGVVFTMREDYVAGLDPYAPLLPRRLRARFRMERLDQNGALEAIKKPAQDAGCPFAPDVAERLVDDLRRVKVAHDLSQSPGDQQPAVLGPFVEPVQLQVVCNRLWENLPEQEDSTILWKEVEQYGDVDQALTGFYESALAECVQSTKVNERQLRRWFGQQLITPMQTRGLVLRGEHETGGLSNQAVDILSERHLIRADVRAGARWYELSHDRMVDPVLKSNQAWEKKWEEEITRRQPWRPAAKLWHETRNESLLYRGEALEQALAWAQAHPSEVEPLEHEFLEVCQRAQQIRARVRKLQIVGAVSAIVVIIVVSLLALTAYQAGQKARSKAFASNAMRYLSINQEQSIILAQMAVDEADTIEAQITLRQALIDYYPAQILRGDANHIASVAYTPDGQFLAAGMDNGQVQVWETQTQLPALTIHLESAKNNWVYGLDYSPDGRFLAVGGDPPITIWDASTGSLVTTLEGHTGLVYGLDYSPDGRFLASGARDHTVRLWDVVTGISVTTLTGHTGVVRSVDYSPDGRFLASASEDGTVRLWQISTTPAGDLEASAALTLTGHTASVNSVAFNPGGTLLASASDDETIRIWDVSTGEAILALIGHTDLVLSLSFSADGKLLISGSRDATVRVWNVELLNNKPIAVLTGHEGIVNSVACNPAGRFLASGSADGTVRMWDSAPPAGALLTTLTGHTNTVLSLDYSPDSAFLASGSSDGAARIWSTATGETVTTLPVGSTVWGVTYSPDGRHLVTCSADKLARVWDVSTGDQATLVTVLAGHTADVNAAAYSPDGRRLATASDDKTARIWDLTTGQTIVTLVGHTDAIYALDYSPDGFSIATGSVDRDVRLWDAETGELLEILSGHTDAIFSVAYDPIGDFLASGSWDQTARIWDLETYTTTDILIGHNGYVYDAAFSPDGEQLATSSWDNTVRLWDLSQSPPQTTAILTGHTGIVRAVTYSPDGQYVASGSRDGTIRRYLAQFGDAVDLSWEYVPRELTPEEKNLIERLETNPFNY